MCGISGILNFNERPVKRDVLARMTQSLAHRGPDGEALWFDGPVGLGHRRLAIRDLSLLGRQPMTDPTGRVTITYNGEIYNELELRSELERDFGVRFHSTCDAEILPAGYIAWGDALFERLEGMFAIGLWDAAARKLVLARDRVGIKPLFFAHDARGVRFASEIKGVVADPEQPRELNAEGVHRFLAMGYVGGSKTMLRDVEQVEPGTIVTFEREGKAVRRFWRPQRRSSIRSFDEAVETFVPIWDRVVSDHLISDVPIAVLQSGGVDSSLIAYAMSQRASHPLFTASFSDSSYDETNIARLVAAHTKLPHHIVPISADSAPEQTLRTVVHHFDGHVADESAGPLLLLTKELRRYSIVALSGDGGDEFFGGYSTYRASHLAFILGRFFPSSVAQTIGRIAYRSSASDSRLPATALLARFMLGLAASRLYAHAEWRRYLPSFIAPLVYGPELQPFLQQTATIEYRNALDNADGETFLDRCMIADEVFHLPGGLLAKTDAMSMANGVEIRVPFLDRRIMEFSAKCDVRLLLGDRGETKSVLRRVLQHYGAPREVSSAPKRGFNSPLSQLLRGPLRPLANHIFEDQPVLLEPYLRPDGVRALWRSHLESRCNHAYALWPMLTFGLWRSNSRIGFDRQSPEPDRR